MAKIQFTHPALSVPCAFSTPDSLIVASEAGLLIVIGDEGPVLRLALTWQETSTLVKKVLDRIPAILERKVT